MRRAAAAGFPVGVHAIGDLANRDALDAFEATRDAWEPLGLRQRIEHAQLLAPEDVAALRGARRHGVGPVQPRAVGPRSRRAPLGRPDRPRVRVAVALDAGALLVNGSDAPIEELDPWAGVVAGVLRTLDDRPAWHPEQAVTIEEALRATTVNPAWLAGDERRRGRLLPGYLADLVVLDRDPFACAPDELRDVRVVATMVGGRWVHGSPPWTRE